MLRLRLSFLLLKSTTRPTRTGAVSTIRKKRDESFPLENRSSLKSPQRSSATIRNDLNPNPVPLLHKSWSAQVAHENLSSVTIAVNMARVPRRTASSSPSRRHPPLASSAVGHLLAAGSSSGSRKGGDVFWTWPTLHFMFCSQVSRSRSCMPFAASSPGFGKGARGGWGCSNFSYVHPS